MSILIDVQNEQEEKVLLAFLNSLNFKFKTITENDNNLILTEFLKNYNHELDDAEHDIESGEFLLHKDVEKLLENRRKSL
ncbi:MAG: hypothetical protein WCY25_00505 [Moheibacter sp.]